MRVKINVLQKDIRPFSNGQCPIDRAAKRDLTAASGLATLAVSTGVHYCHLSDDDRAFAYNHLVQAKLPKRASAWVRKFDAEKKVKPFSFWLEV
jgi:hypothetical protein